jgi:hypothetical protein
MPKRRLVKGLFTLSALLSAMVAAISAVAGTAGAATPDGYGCYWENAYSNKLWVRQYPDKSAATLGSLTDGTLFWGTKYNAYNQGVHWVRVSAGGWVNADYIVYIKGWDKTYTQSYCLGL